MRIISTGVVAVLFLLSAAWLSASSANKGESGRVLSASVNGHGEGKPGSRLGTRDIWWNYCISTADRSYSVVSRLSPAKSGLNPNTAVTFSVQQNEVFLSNPSGKKISLRIERKGESGKCPK